MWILEGRGQRQENEKMGRRGTESWSFLLSEFFFDLKGVLYVLSMRGLFGL